jgi:hypothetical protein
MCSVIPKGMSQEQYKIESCKVRKQNIEEFEHKK